MQDNGQRLYTTAEVAESFEPPYHRNHISWLCVNGYIPEATKQGRAAQGEWVIPERFTLVGTTFKRRLREDAKIRPIVQITGREHERLPR